MKNLLLSFSLIFSLSALAAPVKNSPKASIKVSRVHSVVTLVDKEDIKVKVVVEDLGLSTDVSPTKKIYLSLYTPGEMSDAESTFTISESFNFISAKRVSAGIYRISASIPDDSGMPRAASIIVDASKAIVGIKNMSCEEFSTCEYTGTVDVKIAQ